MRPGSTPAPPTRRWLSSTRQYAAWSAGRGARSATTGLARPCGADEGPFATYPLAALVLHINREMIHHGAEICLLRDLYLRRTADDQESA